MGSLGLIVGQRVVGRARDDAPAQSVPWSVVTAVPSMDTEADVTEAAWSVTRKFPTSAVTKVMEASLPVNLRDALW